MTIHPASQTEMEQAIGLLALHQLPTSDISAGTQLFVAKENDEVLGTVAVEYSFDDALLRSLSVAERKRNSGLGSALVDFIEDYVRKQGVRAMYLLTTTAASFFSKKGYRVIAREEAPPFIRGTSEYSSVCPSSASFMKKDLV